MTDPIDIDPVERFYKMKSKYDRPYINYKNTIMNSDLTRMQKKARITGYKRQCINCGRYVGTFFSNKNKQLTARCGDTKNPCGLEYIVSVGSSGYIPDLIEYFYKQLENIKKNIIQIKLSLLFGLETEENITETFIRLKEEYKTGTKVLDNLEHYIFEDEKVSYQVMGEDKKNPRHEAVKYYKVKFGNLITSYKSIIKSFEEDSSAEAEFILEDAIDKYKTEITPLIKEMKSKLFDIIAIIDDDEEEGKKRLIKDVLSIDKYEVDYSSSEILSDKK